MTVRESQDVGAAPSFDEQVTRMARSPEPAASSPLVAAPLLRALYDAGTSHVYADTADVEELGRLLQVPGGVLSGIDGNTANQPLVRKVITRYLEKEDPLAWAKTLQQFPDEVERIGLLPLLYTVLCGRIGNDVVHRFACGRSWEVSLQIHMGLVGKPKEMMRVGRLIRRMVPSAIVKVPFAPHAPDCFLVARDLEREGIPVNFTSTFSARQAVAAGLLANVTRTNIFMGRLDQGLQAKLLGAEVDLHAQRALGRLRMETGIQTQLIVASLRDWRSFVQTAGCDVYTSPCGVLNEFLRQSEVRPDQIETQLVESYEPRLGIPTDVQHKLGPDRIARLYRVEDELTEFLRSYRVTDEYQSLSDGDRLAKRFEEAGFGDFFYVPRPEEWEEFRQRKIPDLDARITTALSLDTLYSLLADADFGNHQDAMDRELTDRLEGR